MRVFLFLISTLHLLGANTASAQPSFDCAKASSDVEETIYSDPALGALDQRLAERYASALAAIRTMDNGSETAEKELHAVQRGWIKGRNDCWKAEDLLACVEAAYHTREAELVGLWMLEEPTAVHSFFCEGNRANEVTVYFFATEVPSIRVEYGDSIRTGSLVPAASGSKYAMPFGGTFWQKGKKALFEWTEGQAMSCQATE